MKTKSSILIKYSLFIFSVAVVSVLFKGNLVSANITPTFSFNQPNSYSAKITVYGDPNSAVGLHYGNLASLSNTIGSTDENGFLSTSVSSSSYGVACGNTAYVSINGLQSVTIPWTPADSACTSLPLSQTSINLSKGQSTSIVATDNSAISLVSTSNSGVVNSNVIGKTIYITASNIGTTNLIVCASDNVNLCGTVLITVSATGASNITFNQNNIVLEVGDSQSITMSGSGTGTYYISSNSNPTNVSASITDNIVNLRGLSFGSSTITVCQNNGGCGTLYISIVNIIQNAKSTSNSATSSVVSDTSTTTTVVKAEKTFVTNLKLGSKGAEVRSLQSKLKTLKFYSGVIDGKFGAGTEKAVKAFQKANKLEQVGNVGPKTRALLNK